METTLHDVYDPLPPDSPGIGWPWLVSGTLLALVVLIVVIVWLRRKPRIPIIPANVLAHSRLSRLQSTASEESGAECAAQLSGILRDYLGAHYQLPADRLTTDEIRPLLTKREREADMIDTIHTLLSACDDVRFSNTDLPLEERTALCARAGAIIEKLETSAAAEGDTAS